MHLCRTKFNIFVILVLFAFLTSCTTSSYYAPVRTDNNQVFAGNIPKPLISKQHIDTGNLIVASNIGTQHTAANLQTFHSMDSSTRLGSQRPALWNKKLAANNNLAKNKTASPAIEKAGTNKKKLNSSGVNTVTRQTKTVKSAIDKSNSKIGNAHKKQPAESHLAQQPKRQREKSIASIDNKKMLELGFCWPIKGKVLKSYSPSRNKGIDIAGRNGQPVKAAEAGKVVYGGQGLIGFGKLLIIKHNDVYLSAYANNSVLLVNEGELVKKGQVVAEVGKAGIKRISLHFEIRENGKPVNPLKFLPKK